MEAAAPVPVAPPVAQPAADPAPIPVIAEVPLIAAAEAIPEAVPEPFAPAPALEEAEEEDVGEEPHPPLPPFFTHPLFYRIGEVFFCRNTQGVVYQIPGPPMWLNRKVDENVVYWDSYDGVHFMLVHPIVSVVQPMSLFDPTAPEF